mmetsp:Transcript_75146/g.223990  ORF Transcript_75146/g.223990 Transcript_75146/m.223990 type:complete len:243 (-) Transcript_75146:19-747(-)
METMLNTNMNCTKTFTTSKRADKATLNLPKGWFRQPKSPHITAQSQMFGSRESTTRLCAGVGVAHVALRCACLVTVPSSLQLTPRCVCSSPFMFTASSPSTTTTCVRMAALALWRVTRVRYSGVTSGVWRSAPLGPTAVRVSEPSTPSSMALRVNPSSSSSARPAGNSPLPLLSASTLLAAFSRKCSANASKSARRNASSIRSAGISSFTLHMSFFCCTISSCNAAMHAACDPIPGGRASWL